ncbi:MAG: DUF3333 domain-containing protein, partial [Steroidobacteraceae bacterium]
MKSAAATQQQVRNSLARRYRAERRFRFYGLAAVSAGIAFVVFLFGTIFAQGLSVFQQSYVKLEVFYDPETLDPSGDRNPDDLVVADYQALIRASLREEFPQVEGRRELRELYGLMSSAASIVLQRSVTSDPDLIGQRQTLWLLADDTVDMVMKGKVSRTAPEDERRLSDQQIAWLQELELRGDIDLRFNRSFFSNGDSRD